MPKEAFLINPPKRVRRKSKRKASSKKRRTSVRRKRNPMGYGKEVVVVGRNPRRRKRRASKRRSVSKRRRNPVAATRRVRRTYRKRRNPVARVSRRRTRRSYRHNPVVRRRHRRNPAMSLSMGGINFKKPMTLIMPIATGIASTIVTRKVPDMLNLMGWQRTGAQVAVAVLGGMVLRKPLGTQNAAIWAVVSLVNTAGELLRDKIGGVFSGYSAFVDRQVPYAGGAMMSTGSMYGAFVDRQMDEYGSEYEADEY